MPMQTQGGGEAIASAYFQPSIRSRWVVSTMLGPLYPLVRLPDLSCRRLIGPRGTESLACTVILSSGGPVCSEKLYGLQNNDRPCGKNPV